MPDHDQGVIPMISYDDGFTALDWLARAFGFKERVRMAGPDGRFVACGDGDRRRGHHARLTEPGLRGSAEAPPVLRARSPVVVGPVGIDGLLVFVRDVDAHFARASHAARRSCPSRRTVLRAAAIAWRTSRATAGCSCSARDHGTRTIVAHPPPEAPRLGGRSRRLRRRDRGDSPKLRGVAPKGLPHSPWQLLEHLRSASGTSSTSAATRLRRARSRWRSTGRTPPRRRPARRWEESIAEFRRDRDALKKMAEDETLDLFAKIPHGTGQTYLRELLLVADHNAYHVGQLVARATAPGDLEVVRLSAAGRGGPRRPGVLDAVDGRAQRVPPGIEGNGGAC